MEGKKESFDQLAQSLRSMNDAVYSYVTQNPKISQSVIGQLEQVGNQAKGIWQSVIAKLGSREIGQTPFAQSDIGVTVSVPCRQTPFQGRDREMAD